MLEKIYNVTTTENKTIEQIVLDDNVNINHMILREGDSLPLHYSNSNVYMVVIKGVISLKLDKQDEHQYRAGNIINIPYNTHMNVYNANKDLLEFYVVKAPSPKNYKAK